MYYIGKYLTNLTMKNTTAQRLFDPATVRVDEGLRGVRLASFTRRFGAYLIDWTLILICSEFVWAILPLGLLFLWIKRRLRSTLQRGHRTIEANLLHIDRRLARYELSERLKRRCIRYLRVYVYMLMYTPIAIAVITVAAMIYNAVFPQTYVAAVEEAETVFGTIFRPIDDLGDGLNLLIRFFGAYLYFTLFTWQWRGQTPGKKLLHVRIIRLDGQPLSFWNSSERATGYTASTALLFTGFLQYFWDRHCQTTHDKIAETLVVHTRTLANRPSEQEVRESSATTQTP